MDGNLDRDSYFTEGSDIAPVGINQPESPTSDHAHNGSMGNEGGGITLWREFRYHNQSLWRGPDSMGRIAGNQRQFSVRAWLYDRQVGRLDNFS